MKEIQDICRTWWNYSTKVRYNP